MKTTILSILGLILLTVSCSQEPTLQKYFVEHAESKDFILLDVAPNFMKADKKLKLTPEEQKALNSMHKLNVLALQATPTNKAQLKAEQKKVQELLKGEEYEELMHIGAPDKGAAIHMVGEGDAIEEFVVYVHQEKSGMAVVRILGEDMNPNNIMTLVGLLQKGNLNLEQLKPLEQLMTSKK
jgi:hypothetical protein